MFGQASNKKKQQKRLAEYEAKLQRYEAQLKKEDDASRIHMLNPSRICPNPDQPRRRFDQAQLQSLADSISRYGMIQPLTVRRISDEDSPFGGLYELIAGERRLRAARMLDLQYVPCIILEADREESAKLALVENVQRHGLSYFEEAEAIETLIKKYGVKQQEAADMLSVSQSYVANKLRLLRLDPEERKIAETGGLTERHIRAALKAQSPELRKKILYTAASRSYNVRQTEQYVLQLCEEKKEQSKNEKIVIKDIRIFLNTIDKAVNIVRQAGIPVEQSRSDGDGMIELKIRVPGGCK
ncbi:MAG: ParB/RepB/Spo0J family partition protein [Clostridia bacterium]|nr:ParB/RepB/Spo0J family partition protein [Clostridia bacterium]